MGTPESLDRGNFRDAYARRPPWDIDGPQRAFVEAAGMVTGTVLDAGCGTGEHALFLAGRGHAVTGIDFLEEPVAIARRRAAERGLRAAFLVKDALTLREWPERFDTAIDSGLFHVFADGDRARYVAGLREVVKPGGRLLLLCFSDATPGDRGPRRLTGSELRDAFAEGWTIESLAPARFEVRPELRGPIFGDEDPHAWFMIARRAA